MSGLCAILLASAGRAGGLEAQAPAPCCRITAITRQGAVISLLEPGRKRMLVVRLRAPHTAAALALRVGTTLLRYSPTDSTQRTAQVGGGITLFTTDGSRLTGTLTEVRLNPQSSVLSPQSSVLSPQSSVLFSVLDSPG